jgi:hypothetical protein
MNYKFIRKEQYFLINKLLELAGININLENKLVAELDDGKMGSLRFNGSENRKYGKTISEYQFHDRDGVVVLASLFLDENNDLFEIDIWKTDFSELIEWPQM